MGNGQVRAQEIHHQLQGKNPHYLLPERVESCAFSIGIINSSIIISVSCQNSDFDEIMIRNDKDNVCGYCNDVRRFGTYDELAKEINRIVSLVIGIKLRASN